MGILFQSTPKKRKLNPNSKRIANKPVKRESESKEISVQEDSLRKLMMRLTVNQSRGSALMTSVNHKRLISYHNWRTLTNVRTNDYHQASHQLMGCLISASRQHQMTSITSRRCTIRRNNKWNNSQFLKKQTEK